MARKNNLAHGHCTWTVLCVFLCNHHTYLWSMWPLPKLSRHKDAWVVNLALLSRVWWLYSVFPVWPIAIGDSLFWREEERNWNFFFVPHPSFACWAIWCTSVKLRALILRPIMYFGRAFSCCWEPSWSSPCNIDFCRDVMCFPVVPPGFSNGSNSWRNVRDSTSFLYNLQYFVFRLDAA